MAAGAASLGCASPSGPTQPTEAEGHLLVNTNGDQVAVAGLTTGAVSRVPGLGGTTARFVGGANLLAHGGGTTIQRRDAATGVSTTVYTSPAGQSVSGIAVSPDGSRSSGSRRASRFPRRESRVRR